ncbi:MAG: GGDEF domain-containing protein [Spirochaetales bacterium]|nr:GGDEF domain-containing protein [Spirochaetales bacterium]
MIPLSSELTQALSRLKLFSSLTPGELERVGTRMMRLEIEDGGEIFREGEPGRLMYVVLEGQVSISIRTDDGQEVEVSRAGEGSFFGEMSLLEKQLRSATCRAVGHCVLMSMDDRRFGELVSQEPATAIKIMDRMLITATTRLRNTGAFVSDMVQWGEQARVRALTDDFTGLYNRRFFDEAVASALTEAKSRGDVTSLVILDLDRFGTLNAEYGEAVGDEVILAAVEVFQACFEEHDILCRYGGDEFAFILPGRSGEEALSFCEKAGQGLRELKILPPGKGSFHHVGASMGIASTSQDVSDVPQWMEWADQALYAAKEAGRDRAVLYRSGDSE